MKGILICLAGLPLLLQGDGFELELTVTNGAGITKDSIYTLHLAAVATAGRTSDANYDLLLGPTTLSSLHTLIPGDVSIAGVDSHRVTIQWNDILSRFPGSSIEVRRSTKRDSDFVTVLTVGTGTSTTDTTPANGILYYYALRLRAKSGYGPHTVSLPAISTGHRALGDVDGDGDTDGSDLVQLAFRHGLLRTTSGPKWLSSADVDGDGKVDDADLAVLREEVGRVYR